MARRVIRPQLGDPKRLGMAPVDAEAMLRGHLQAWREQAPEVDISGFEAQARRLDAERRGRIAELIAQLTPTVRRADGTPVDRAQYAEHHPNIIRALEQLGKDTAPQLVLALRDADHALAHEAANVLAALEPGEEVHAALVSLFEQPPPSTEDIDFHAFGWALTRACEQTRVVSLPSEYLPGTFVEESRRVTVFPEPYRRRLLALLDSPRADLRKAVAFLLHNAYEDEEIFQALLARVEQPEIESAAIQAANLRRDPRAVPVFKRLFEREQDAGRAGRFIEAIGNSGDLAFLRARFQGAPLEVQESIIHVLGTHGEPGDLRLVKDILADPKAALPLRMTALARLGERSDTRGYARRFEHLEKEAGARRE